MKRDAHSKSRGREGRLLQEHPCLDMASFGYPNSLVTRGCDTFTNKGNEAQVHHWSKSPNRKDYVQMQELWALAPLRSE